MPDSNGRAPCNRHCGVQITPVQQMVSSCTGAILTSILVTPLDVVKIRLQAQKKPDAFTKGKCFLYCNGLMDHMCACVNGQLPPSLQWYKKPLPAQFNGTVDAFVKIVRYEGVTSLWSGLPPTMVMAVPATVVYFTMYEQMKAGLAYDETCKSDWWKPMASGGTARVWAATMISPLEMIRTKMQSEQLTYRAMASAISKTVENNGVVSLWKGLGPTLLRDVPFSAFYWLSYESMKAYVLESQGTPELSFGQSFAAGAGAGTVAAIVTLPFDVIKTHQQVTLGDGGKQVASSNTWTMIRKLYVTEGFHALFAGLVPRIVKVAPACAIMISTYEYFKTFFYTRNMEARFKGDVMEPCSTPTSTEIELRCKISSSVVAFWSSDADVALSQDVIKMADINTRSDIRPMVPCAVSEIIPVEVVVGGLEMAG